MAEGAVTEEFHTDLESNMRVIASNAYAELAKDLWWERVARVTTSQAKRERLMWLIETAMIKRAQPGTATFETMITKAAEYEAEFAEAGLEITKEKLEDLEPGTGKIGGEGLRVAAEWSKQVGQQAAYWPQDQVAKAIREGGEATSLAYDGVPFFDDEHLVNGVDDEDGVYANDLTPTVMGGTAAKIDESVTVDVAFKNLQRVFAKMASVPMPNGKQPRKLRPVGILVPPALMSRAQQLTNARLIAQAAATGGGGADVEAIIRNWGIGQPIQADELAAAFGGSDTTYYVLAAGIDRNELGALLYVLREAFAILFHGPMTSAELARKRLFQWLLQGRNVVGYGHPYLLFRVPAA